MKMRNLVFMSIFTIGMISCNNKKLTEEKFISECKYFYKEKQSELRDNND